MTADDKARLDALTPDVLRAMAAGCRHRLAGIYETRKRVGALGAATDCLVDTEIEWLSRLAALCEAVAAAQEAIRTVGVTGEVLTIAGIGDRGVATNVHRDLWEGACLCEDEYETLAAALGAVGVSDPPEAHHDA